MKWGVAKVEIRGIKNKPAVMLTSAFAGLVWAGLIGAIFLYKVGSSDLEFWSPARVLTYVLFLIAPALTFVPIGKALGAGWYGWLAVISWAAFGFMLEFLPHTPGWRENLTPLLFMLGALFLVVFSLSWPIFFLLGFKLFHRRVARYDLGRSLREAFLLATYVISIFMLAALRNLNPTYAGALFFMFLAIELLFVTRSYRTN
jgi:hypothetical protein